MATRDYPKIKPVITPPTRGTAVLDIIATNMTPNVIEAGVTEPVNAQDGTKSDHKTVSVRFKMSRVPNYKLDKYTYIRKNSASLSEFDVYLREQDWDSVYKSESPTGKVQALHRIIEQGINKCFEKKTSVRKTSEPAWISLQIRTLIRRRRAIIKREGRLSLIHI